MRLLLDMGLSPQTAAHLRQQGHDAVHLHDDAQQRWPDERIIARAFSERRIIVTFDLDFSRLLALQRTAQPSVILFRLERFTTREINERLASLLTAHAADLERGAVLVVEPAHVRIRNLPIW